MLKSCFLGNRALSPVLGIIIAGLFAVGAAYAASMNVWTCKKCQLTVKSEKRPQIGTCPEKGGHYWTLMAEAGDENWQCKKCSKVLHTNGRPQTGFCPKGGGHHWQKL